MTSPKPNPDSPKPPSSNAYLIGTLPHVDQFLSVPGARVTVDHTETSCSIETALAVVGRIASAQPGARVKYWFTID